MAFWPGKVPFAISNSEKKKFVRLSDQIFRAKSCVNCIGNPISASDCEPVANKLDRIYCDKENTIVNPFMVLTGFAKGHTDNRLPLRCRLYLLQNAYQQSIELVKRRDINARGKSLIQFGGSLHFMAQNGVLSWGSDDRVEEEGSDFEDCPVSPAIGKLSRQVAQILAPDYQQAYGDSSLPDNGETRLTNQYCEAVLPACQLLGGSMKKYKGKLICRRGGIVLDQSCLTLNTEKRKNVARALSNVVDKGALCLFNDFLKPQYGTAALKAGQALADHLNTPENIRTQVCCGDDGCKSNLKSEFGNYSRLPARSYSGMEAMAYSTSSEEAGRSKGIIEISDRGMDSFTSHPESFSATLFHEFLHRVGLPTSPYHNYRGGMVEAKNGVCPTLGDDTFQERGGMCFSNNPCYDRARGESIYRYDVVYACTAACFPGTQHNSQDPNKNLTDKEMDEAKETCGRYAAHGNFTGTNLISNLPPAPGTGPDQEENLCTFWRDRTL